MSMEQKHPAQPEEFLQSELRHLGVYVTPWLGDREAYIPVLAFGGLRVA